MLMEIERQKRAGAERMMAGQAAERDREQAVDLALLFAGIRRRWVVIATLAAMLASSAFVLATPPRHPGFAQMMLEDQGIISPRPTPRPGSRGPALFDDAAVQSQAEAVATAGRSTSLASRPIPSSAA